MKRLIRFVMIGLLAGGVTIGVAEAGDRGGHGHPRHSARRAAVHQARYFGHQDVVVIREYYRPYYRPVPRPTRYVYARSGYLPPGWAARVRPIPVYVAHQLPPVPYGYHRGIIDGHAVVYNPSGFIFDVAVLF